MNRMMIRTDFFLSMSGMSLFSAFSTMTYSHGICLGLQQPSLKKGSQLHEQEKKDLTGILSGYFSLMRLASACLLSVTHSINRMTLRLFYTANINSVEKKLNKVSIENQNQ
jgi:hypothetical protein